MRAKFFTRPTAWPWNTTAPYWRVDAGWSSAVCLKDGCQGQRSELLLRSASSPDWCSSPQLSYLRGLGRTHHAPQCVVQLSGFCQFSVSTNGRVDAAEVRQSGSKGETVQHLQAQTEGSNEVPVTRSKHWCSAAGEGIFGEADLPTWDTPALAWWAFFTSPQFPVAREYFRPSEMVLVLMASSRLKSFPPSMYFWVQIRISFSRFLNMLNSEEKSGQKTDSFINVSSRKLKARQRPATEDVHRITLETHKQAQLQFPNPESKIYQVWNSGLNFCLVQADFDKHWRYFWG